MTGKTATLTTPAARRIWLRAQRLDVPEPFGTGPEATRRAVQHLGYVQIDTINVIERCHHHILYTRIPKYRRDDLHQAQSVDKTVFEYWTHALSYLPTTSMPFYIRAMKRHWRRRSAWFGAVKPQDLRKVMGLLHKNGPLTIRDIDDDVLVEKDHLWASRKPSKRALQLAFYRGVVTVSRRAGMLKTYDLMTRHFNWDRLPKAASETESLDYRLDRALNAQGIVSLDSVCYLEPGLKTVVRRRIEARVRRDTLVPVVVGGAGEQEHWARPEALGERFEPADGMVHILSPFDPITSQRKRLALFFGYEHRFEAYVPKARRVLGYFACPVLIDDEIVAAIDLKTERENGKMLVQQWTWLADASRRARRRQIEEALHRFERFQLAR